MVELAFVHKCYDLPKSGTYAFDRNETAAAPPEVERGGEAENVREVYITTYLGVQNSHFFSVPQTATDILICIAPLSS